VVDKTQKQLSIRKLTDTKILVNVLFLNQLLAISGHMLMKGEVFMPCRRIPPDRKYSFGHFYTYSGWLRTCKYKS